MRFWIAPHLAFLVQWLRALGVNATLWDKGVILDREGETIVQWDRYPLPLERIRVNRITLSSADRETLLKEFFVTAGLQPDPKLMFKRCLRCNTPLITLTPEEAKNKWAGLPAYVFETQNRFNWCDHCNQLFWAGTHVRNMIRTLETWGVIPAPNNS